MIMLGKTCSLPSTQIENIPFSQDRVGHSQCPSGPSPRSLEGPSEGYLACLRRNKNPLVVLTAEAPIERCSVACLETGQDHHAARTSNFFISPKTFFVALTYHILSLKVAHRCCFLVLHQSLPL